ncbi:hypothetical protein ACEPAF_7106 [Sanghuangporus sanghuang]
MASNNHGNVRSMASESFLRVFTSVPTLTQAQIVKQALIPFLDTIPRKDAKRAIASARRIAKKAHHIPQVDVAAKKKEIEGLLDELSREAKFTPRSSGNKYDIMFLEIIESVAQWLNELWSLAFEFGLDFPRVHACLLMSMSILDQVQSMKGTGHQRLFSTVYAPVVIRDRSGKIVKEFNELGISNVESAILWVWRDVFLALLASKNPAHVRLVPELLAEIDNAIGWSGLERLVLGGDTYFQDGDELQFSDPDFLRLRRPEDSNWGSQCSSEDRDRDDMFYADHWNYRIVKQVPRFRQLIEERMIDIFKAAPSILLYTIIVNLSGDISVLDHLHEILSWLAPTSTSSLATALGIYCIESKFDQIASLLETHAFLLRPRESYAIHESVRLLTTSYKPAHQELALRTAEKELLETIETIRHSLLGPFAHLDSRESRSELRQLTQLSHGTTERQERVERWVETVSTPGMGTANPMAVAAMMMGMPIPVPMPIPPQGDAGGGAGFNAAAAVAAAAAAATVAFGDAENGMMDLDPHDPDFSELREEPKPDLKGRFEEWVETVKYFGYLRAAVVIRDKGEGEGNAGEGGKGLEEYAGEVVIRESVKGDELLMNVFKSMHNSMPWVLATDVVNEMIVKLADDPSKQHICDALRSLSSFVKLQKKKRKKMERIANGSHASITTEEEGERVRSTSADVGFESFGTGEDGSDAEEGAEGDGGGEVDVSGWYMGQIMVHNAANAPENHAHDGTDDSDVDNDQTEAEQIATDFEEALHETLAQLLVYSNPNPNPGNAGDQEFENIEPAPPFHPGAPEVPSPNPIPGLDPGPLPFFTHAAHGSIEDLD